MVQYAETRVDLLEKLNQYVNELPADSASAISTKKMHNLLTNVGTSLFAEGEDLYNFAAIMAGKVVCGVFEHANRLQAGDEIAAVVSARDGVLFAHSVKRKSDHLLLLPREANGGQDALYRRCVRFAWRMTIFLWILFGAGQIVYNLLYPESGQSYLFDFLVTLLAPPLLMFTTELFTYRQLNGAGQYARAIFEAYQIPRPDSFDALAGMDLFTQETQTFFAMNAERALNRHLKKFKIENASI